MPIADIVLAQNISVTIREAYIQAEHAQSVGTRARTGYYKLSILLMASTVEALLYHLIEVRTTADPSLLHKKKFKHLKRLHSTIPGSSISITKDLVLCEEVNDIFELSTKVMFKQLNIFCRDTSLIDQNLYHEIEYVIRKRNEIHLQGLISAKRTFTAHMLERVSVVTAKLYVLI